MPWLRFLVVLTCFLICSMRAKAAPAPIVFDFEDGLQGWELHGAATRVQTQVLGGEWAIFGDGFVAPAGSALIGNIFDGSPGTAISIIADPTKIRSITVEQRVIDGDEQSLVLFLGIEGLLGLLFGEFFLFDTPDPDNPSLQSYDLSAQRGRSTEMFRGPSAANGLIPIQADPLVMIGWSRPTPGPLDPPSSDPSSIVAFIDNITFHPVPESSSWLLLSLGIAGMVMIRRKLAS